MALQRQYYGALEVPVRWFESNSLDFIENRELRFINSVSVVVITAGFEPANSSSILDRSSVSVYQLVDYLLVRQEAMGSSPI